MPDFLRIAATLREQMQADLSRSDVLRVLIWPILILMLALLTAVQAKAPSWALIGIAAFVGFFLVVYAFAFIGLLVYDRDALRSEKYTLHKMAIEHGLFGDSQVGLMQEGRRKENVQTVEATPVLEQPK
jgi:membrane protein YdbS with pleckstrin-like domain